MTISTAFTDLFGVTHPIVCGGMTGRHAGLIAAVAETGALGFMPAHNSPSRRRWSRTSPVRDLTDQPFGRQLHHPASRNPPPWEEYMRATVDSGITAVETAGQNPEPYLRCSRAAV